MTSEISPQQKAGLLERIRSSRAELDQIVGQLSEQKLGAPGSDGGWAVKDHLAHLAAWEQKTLALIEGRPGHEGLQIDQTTYETGETDTINAILQQRFKDLTAAEVLAEAQRSYQRLLSAVEALTPEQLSASYNPSDPEEDRRMFDGIVDNTYDHYDEHRSAIAEICAYVG